ncbi:hypothetical protein SH661x_003386 [Planctomicrobium sp. SH661]|uniref:hypothetical protein n=1 Tax=Planctomicrobium sp. SH661 TaxID=3448124 RepID=UPI003F5BAF85
MKEVLEFLLEKFNENWIKIVVAAGFTLIGWFLGHRRAKRDWTRREFFDRINVSLNSIRDGRLRIRTLLEKRCEDVFLNTAAARVVTEAAQRTTAQDPLLKLPQGEDWYYLNSVLNEIAERFATGVMKQDLGGVVQCREYVLCLTCEAAGNLKQKKIRSMLIRKDLIENLPQEPPEFESPHHSTRWQTLQQLAASYAKTPERFMTMEICL